MDKSDQASVPLELRLPGETHSAREQTNQILRITENETKRYGNDGTGRVTVADGPVRRTHERTR